MIGQAILNLSPNAKWRLEGTDYSNIEWFSDDIEKPTQAQVDAEISRLITQTETDKQAAETHKQNAISKLSALGLSADEIAALGVK